VALFAENGPRWLLADQGIMRAASGSKASGAA
jgi:long-subunit acyl-CoA synthetase (AMP-forming)